MKIRTVCIVEKLVSTAGIAIKRAKLLLRQSSKKPIFFSLITFAFMSFFVMRKVSIEFASQGSCRQFSTKGWGINEKKSSF